MADKYRPGIQNPRERYSNRLQMLHVDDIWMVLEFDQIGVPVDRALFDERDYSEEHTAFDAAVEEFECKMFLMDLFQQAVYPI